MRPKPLIATLTAMEVSDLGGCVLIQVRPRHVDAERKREVGHVNEGKGVLTPQPLHKAKHILPAITDSPARFPQ
jgi:hypothetical protein